MEPFDMEALAIIGLLCAAVPCFLFFLNLYVYRRPRVPLVGKALPAISVLIPARDEAETITAALDALLANRDVDFEVVVLDDQSTDRTAAIVQEYSRVDGRIRLESAPPLPPGWCGKQHSCFLLASHARHPWLLFLDADVRLFPDALKRLATLALETPADLMSGVPRQETRTFSEKLLIPLIHFLLLGFLPMLWARRSAHPAFAAGCGQLFLIRAEAYRLAGGHAAIRSSLHDGLKLPRAFRRAGFKTSLFDATQVAVCRMYGSNAQVWAGLAKNAVEGLAAPNAIVPMTLMLGAGQILPWLLLATGAGNGVSWIVALAALLSLLPRLGAAVVFKQPWVSALLHPLGIAALLSIQWAALARHLRGQPATWRGRVYGAATQGSGPETAVTQS